MEEESREFMWVTHLVASLFLVPICAVASVVPILFGRGYIGYSLPTAVDKNGFFGLREFVLMNRHPWLKLKYLLPAVYVALVVYGAGARPVLGYVITNGIILGVMCAVALGVSFLFPSLDEKPPPREQGGD